MVRLIALTIGLLWLSACSRSEPPLPALASPEELQAHSAEFEQQVIRVADGVYMAIGYGIANSIMLEGEDGVIIVDTMETLEAGQAVMAAFRNITDKPVQAIVYTHSHPDHIGGSAAFAEGRDIPVYAHRQLVREMERTSVELQPVITARSLRMYGHGLDTSGRINLGIGGFLDVQEGSTMHTLRPTVVFDDHLRATEAGIEFELFHAPGETADQLFVWLPKSRILLPGDNLYRAFPNLYTLRGTPYRDPRQWADSIDRMRALAPKILVPSHTRPIIGPDAVMQVLTDYRDAIRFVYDQTLRGINQGRSPEAIAATLQLPPHLAESPWLREFYGTPAWSARSIFGGMLGWFDGNPTQIRPLPPQAIAQRRVQLAGGVDAYLAAIEQAQADQDPQWVLHLTDDLLAASPEHAAGLAARVSALRQLGSRETNPNARHWYLVQAAELAGELTLPDRILTPTPQMLADIPMARFFDGLAVNLDAEAARDVTTAVGFVFSDSGEQFTYRLRRGASEVVPGLQDDADLVVRMSGQVFKEMLAQLRSPAGVLTREIRMEKGNRLAFAQFLRLFVPVED